MKIRRPTVSTFLRCVAFALGSFALAWGTTGNTGLVAVCLGATIGSPAGGAFARSRLRLPVLLAGCVALPALFWGLAALGVDYGWFPGVVGPARALVVASVLRFFSLAFAAVVVLRVLATRKPSLIALELTAVAAAIATAFAAHREGNLSRPLWLSDWAWRNGIDPATVLLGVGFLSAGLLATVLLSETKSKRKVSAVLTLGGIAVIILLIVTVVGAPKPKPMTDVPATIDSTKPHPPPPPPDAGLRLADGGPPEDGGGSRGDAAPVDGGGYGDAQELEGGAAEGGAADGAADAASPPPPPSDASSEGGSPPPPNQPPPRPRLTEDPSNSPSNAPIAVVILEDDYSPPYQAYYFRQEALSQYNGTRLVATGRSDADRDGMSVFPAAETTVDEVPPTFGRKLVGTKTALLVEHPNPFGLEAPLSFTPATNPNPARFVRVYRTKSLAQTIELQKLIGKPIGDPRWSPELRTYYTEAPTDPRYKELADSIVAKLPLARQNDQLTEAVAVKLALDHMLTYSTKAKHDGMADPTADMLWGNKIGYCVHFAHAAVFLWRSLGIPARIGVGYHSDEDNRHGGSAIVLRGSDAHAWPEIYVSGLGWMVLDIAAEKNLDPPQKAPDEDLTKLLGDLARDEPKDTPDPAQQQKKKPPPPYGKIAGFGGLGLVAAILLVLYAIIVWRVLAPIFAGKKRMPRVGYRAALDALSRAGLSRDNGETREAFAERVKDTAPSFEKLTALHVAARMRDPGKDRSEAPEFSREEWKTALRATKREVAKSRSFGKRLLAWLNPASFLSSR